MDMASTKKHIDELNMIIHKEKEQFKAKQEKEAKRFSMLSELFINSVYITKAVCNRKQGRSKSNGKRCLVSSLLNEKNSNLN